MAARRLDQGRAQMSTSTFVPDIELTPEEQELFAGMILDQAALDHATSISNGETVAALMKSLMARGGIPGIRLRYFDDPDYCKARVKGSHRDLFRRNGRSDDEIMRHPNFLSHFRYFVCGPDLPADLMTAFRKNAARFGRVGPSDALELGKFARAETRRRGLPPHNACEEFYRLALDCGIYVSHALRIRKTVESIR